MVGFSGKLLIDFGKQSSRSRETKWSKKKKIDVSYNPNFDSIAKRSGIGVTSFGNPPSKTPKVTRLPYKINFGSEMMKILTQKGLENLISQR